MSNAQALQIHCCDIFKYLQSDLSAASKVCRSKVEWIIGIFLDCWKFQRKKNPFANLLILSHQTCSSNERIRTFDRDHRRMICFTSILRNKKNDKILCFSCSPVLHEFSNKTFYLSQGFSFLPFGFIFVHKCLWCMI